MSARSRIPSSIVRYHGKQTSLLPRKISKTEWLFLYNEALRLGYEEPPVLDAPHPGQATTVVWSFDQGSQPADADLFNVGLTCHSTCIISTDLRSFLDNQHAAYVSFEFNAWPTAISRKQFAFTEQTLPADQLSLFFLFQAFVLPADPVNVPGGLIYCLGEEIFRGPISGPSRITGQYISPMTAGSNATCIFSMRSCEFTSTDQTEEFATGALVLSVN
jgi:hypothetical protein